MSIAWPTGVQLVFFFRSRVSKLYGAKGSASSGSLLKLWVLVFDSLWWLFVIDDSLTTTRTEQLSKCCEPLQKLRVRLGTCKIDLSPPVISYYLSFQCNTSVVVLIVLCLFVKAFVLFVPYVCFYILVEFR